MCFLIRTKSIIWVCTSPCNDIGKYNDIHNCYFM